LPIRRTVRRASVSLVTVPAIRVGIVRMAVDQAGVDMPVHVRLADQIAKIVTVLVVIIMNMGVLTLQRFVDMVVVVPLYQMQIQADHHQPGREGQGAVTFDRHGFDFVPQAGVDLGVAAPDRGQLIGPRSGTWRVTATAVRSAASGVRVVQIPVPAPGPSTVAEQ